MKIKKYQLSNSIILLFVVVGISSMYGEQGSINSIDKIELDKKKIKAVSEETKVDKGSTETINDELVYTLDEFVVETKSEEGKVSASASLGALRTAEYLEEIPVTVSVIPQEIMEAFSLYDPDEHAAYVANWLSGETEYGGGGGSRLRGFIPTTYRNGFTRTGVGEVVNVERTEVIKGPLSAMFGQANPGGLINYVTRRAKSKSSYRLVGILGSNAYQRYEGHFTGPLIKDKLFYRLDGSYNYLEGVQDFWFNETHAISANLVYKHSPKTTFYYDIETMDRYMNVGAGAVLNRYNSYDVGGQTVNNVIGGINEELTRAGFNQHGPHARTDREIQTHDFRLEHSLNSNHSLRMNLQYWERTYETIRWTTPQYYVEDRLFKLREPFRQKIPEDSFSGQIDFLSKFWFGNWAQNELLLTFDFSMQGYEREDWRMNLTKRNKLPNDVRNLDPTNPNYGTFELSSLDRLTQSESREANLFGLMARERFALLDGDLILFASGRYDKVKNNVEYSSKSTGLPYPIITPNSSAETENDLFSSSFGGNYKLIGNKLVGFLSLSSSYTPLTKIDIGTGELQDPEKGVGLEGGFRGRIFDDSVYWTASLYQIDRYDIPQRNPEFISVDATPGVPQYIGAGEERSKGCELEINGDPTDNFSFRLTFGYNDATLTKFPDNEAVEGRKLLNAPEFTSSMMLIYRMKEGPFGNLDMGISGLYVDRYYARFGGAGSYVSGTGTINPNPEQPWERNDRIEEIRPSSMTYNFFLQRRFNLGSTKNNVRLNILNLMDEDTWTVTGRLKPGREYRLSWSMTF